MDIVRHPGNARPQAAHAAHHQIDAHAGLAGLVQRADDLRIGQRVELGDDVRRLAIKRVLSFARDHVEHALLQREGCMQQLLHAQRLAHADQLAEQFADVFAQCIVRGQQAVVGVQLGVAGVVVTGTQMRITHDFTALATQDEHHLGVGLEPHHAIDDHRTGGLQAAGQLQVGFFVEARAQFDDCGHFLAVARGIHQRIDDLGVGTAAVQRLPHGQYMGILGGLAQQIDHRRERLERVQQEDVLLADHAEDVLAVLQQFRNLWRERQVLQFWVAVQTGDAEQTRQVDRAVDLIELGLGQVELLEQVVGQMLGAGVGHFQAYRITVAPREQLAAQGTRQVFDVFGVDGQVGVAGQAELVAALYLHALEQVIGVGMDHRGQEDEIVAWSTDVLGHLDHPWQQARRRYDRQARITAEGVDAFELDDEVQTLVHQQRERVCGIQPDRRDDRGDFIAEITTHPSLELGRPVPAANEANLVLLQLRQQDIVEDRVLAIDVPMHQFADSRQRLMRLQTIGPGLFTGEGDLLLQARHADLEELVEVAGEDQQKLEPLEQRIGFIQCLLQHTDIELQLRQLAMDIQTAVVQPRHDDVRRRRKGLARVRGFDDGFYDQRRFYRCFNHRLVLSESDLRLGFVVHLAFPGA